MRNEQYDKYIELKRRLAFRYKGFKIDQLLTIDIWGWANGVCPSNDENKYYNLAYDFSFFKNNKSDYVMFYNIARHDHQDTFQHIAEMVSDVYNIVERYDEPDFTEYHSKYNKWYAIIRVKIALRGLCYSEEKENMISARICMLMNSIDLINKQNIHKVKRYVSYSPIHPGENFMGQYFRKEGGEFYGLTHDIVPFYTKNTPVHCLNYEALDVDKILVWGGNDKESLH